MKNSFRKGFYITSIEINETFSIEFDPFSCYLRDGAPSVWIWVTRTEEVSNTKDYEKSISDKNIYGMHIKLEHKDDWDWQSHSR